jgi:penicillin-binding protein 1A
MGIFRSGSRKGRGRKAERQEPRLFASRGKRSSAHEAEAKPRRRRRSLLGSLFSFAFTLCLMGVVLGGLGFGYIWMSLDQKGLLKIPEREPGMMVTAFDGSIIAERGAFYGDDVRVDELPDYVPNAIIAIEDRRFRHHFGVDPVGLARAMYENFRAGRLVQGGSTLTQQLAKNLFLTPDRTIQRKLQEAVLAIWLETKFSKDEILQLYLNRVYFGAGATGIEQAARKYFARSARDITVPEAAILAAVLKAPTTYNPINNPERAQMRAREVIKDMVESGFLTQEEAEVIATAPATVKASDYVPATQYVVDWAAEILPSLVKDYDQSIVIETTIDPQLQSHAEKALRKRLAEQGRKLNVTQGAIVVLDTRGAVKAMVGGRSYARSQFNRATKAKRQPGSAFKPFAYLAAVEQGYTANSVEVDEPVRIGDWQPENYKRKYLGPVSLQTALALSLNTVAAKVVQTVGPDAVVATARRLGISSPLGNDASIALGTSEVTLLELTAAFSTFADGGVPVVPYLVTRITTRDGRILYERQGDGFGPVVSSYDIGTMNQMMRAVVTEGTGRKAQFGGYDIAGKTGTSQDYRDAWFIGYTTHLVAGVWVGNDDNSPTKKVTGGALPTDIWRDVMEFAHAGLPSEPLPGDALPSGEPQIADGYENDVFGEPYPQQAQQRDDGGFFGSIKEIFGGSEAASSAAQDDAPASAYERHLKRKKQER